MRARREPDLRRCSLVLGWGEDTGGFGRKVTDYLNLKLKGREFADIAPEDFFPMGGVGIADDVARFPESKFYACPEYELVIFQSDSPLAEWYRFLNEVLDVAGHHCRLGELYLLGAMVSFSAHTAPRQLLTVVNSVEMKETISRYDLIVDMDYQTAPGERPTLNSYLLWIARGRNIPGVSLWVPIPFYLAGAGDALAQRKVVGFLSEKLDLRIDFGDLDQEVREQSKRLAKARARFPQIDDYIGRLESNLMLSEEENRQLLRKVDEFLEEGD
jgi:proteasome assembly chaperone (PAC2) family protein